jgi:hypothetical protein
MEKEEVQKQTSSDNFMHSNIPLILNSYEDIFSSFDPRPFSERALSDDFLIECKKAARDKGEFGVELVLSMPKDKRDLNSEFHIKKRLKEHFHKHFLEKENDIKKIKKEGFLWILIGMLGVVIAILIRAFKASTLTDSIVEPVLVIPGWFMIWEGLTKILVHSRERHGDYNFYKKMSTCHIIFRSY